MIFFEPNGQAPFEPGIDSTTIAQQIDIMPTVLEYTGYDRPFIAFGKSLISTTPERNFAVNYNNEMYQYYKDDLILLFDGEKSTGLYNIRKDKLMKENIIGTSNVENKMEKELKAIIQQYMTRMINDRLTAETDKERD